VGIQNLFKTSRDPVKATFSEEPISVVEQKRKQPLTARQTAHFLPRRSDKRGV
jgi:hypothetical protein